jgi:hypothetical protein
MSERGWGQAFALRGGNRNGPSRSGGAAFAKAEKAVKSALAEFQRLHATKLDCKKGPRLPITLESGRNRLWACTCRPGGNENPKSKKPARNDQEDQVRAG